MQKVWEEHYARDQFLANIKHDYLEAQLIHIRLKLINADIEIDYWKEKYKAQEQAIKVLQNTVQDSIKDQNFNSSIENNLAGLVNAGATGDDEKSDAEESSPPCSP